MTTYISDHLPQFLIIEDLKQTLNKEIATITFKDYKSFSDDAFKAELSELDWSLLTENSEVNLGFETFVRLVNRILDKHVPTKIIEKKENKITSKPWVTRGIKTSMKIRDKFYKQMIKTKSKQQKLSKHNSYKKYRNKITELLRISRQTYYQKYFEKNKKNSKRLWQGIHEIISSQKSKKDSSISTIIVDGNTITAPTEMAENFNNFFTLIGKNLQEKIPPTKKTFTDYLKTPNIENFTIGLTSADEISDLICSLDSSKSVSPCSIPTKILKIAREIVSLPLSGLINNSISKGIFPDICKLAQVIPTFKNDSRLLCNNYRPISLLSNIIKIFEKVIHCRLNLFLEQNNCLYPFQFRFRLNYSTNNALMTILESIQKQLDAGNYTTGVFVDLKKVFDTVDHTILLEKLDYYGTRGVAENWFESYLNNRKQFVTLSGSNSSLKPICPGAITFPSLHQQFT